MRQATSLPSLPQPCEPPWLFLVSPDSLTGLTFHPPAPSFPAIWQSPLVRSCPSSVQSPQGFPWPSNKKPKSSEHWADTPVVSPPSLQPHPTNLVPGSAQPPWSFLHLQQALCTQSLPQTLQGSASSPMGLCPFITSLCLPDHHKGNSTLQSNTSSPTLARCQMTCLKSPPQRQGHLSPLLYLCSNSPAHTRCMGFYWLSVHYSPLFLLPLGKRTTVGSVGR